MNPFTHFFEDVLGQTTDFFFWLLAAGIILLIINKVFGLKWLLYLAIILELIAFYHYFIR